MAWNYNFFSGFHHLFRFRNVWQKQDFWLTRLFKVIEYPKNGRFPLVYLWKMVDFHFRNQTWPKKSPGLWVSQPLHAHLGISGWGGGRFLLEFHLSHVEHASFCWVNPNFLLANAIFCWVNPNFLVGKLPILRVFRVDFGWRLAAQVPGTSHPAKYIRFIYNRSRAAPSGWLVKL